MLRRIGLVALSFAVGAGCGSSAAPTAAPDAAKDTAADAAVDAATDTAVASDAGCSTKPTVCCCQGDTVAAAVCKAGTWGCANGYVSYQASNCGVIPAGIGCGLPDVVNTDSQQADTTQSDTTQADTLKGDSAAADSGPVDAAPKDAAPADDVASTDSDQAEVAPGNPCTASGGTVGEGLCCDSAGNFPNSCAVGACGCAPNYSHTVLICNCPAGKCFDPEMGCKAM